MCSKYSVNVEEYSTFMSFIKGIKIKDSREARMNVVMKIHWKGNTSEQHVSPGSYHQLTTCSENTPHARHNSSPDFCAACWFSFTGAYNICSFWQPYFPLLFIIVYTQMESVLPVKFLRLCHHLGISSVFKWVGFLC